MARKKTLSLRVDEKMPKRYVADMNHFLDSSGDIAKKAPKEARELSSFLVLIIDQATDAFPDTEAGVDTGIRCRTKGCRGEIVAHLDAAAEPILWYCLECEHEGTIAIVAQGTIPTGVSSG